MINEFKSLEEKIKLSKNKKSLKVILKIAHNKLKGILSDDRVSKLDRKKAIREFKKLRSKINKKVK